MGNPMDNQHVEITISVQVSLQTLADIITTAVEGGIGHWSECVAYKWTEGPEHTYADIIETGDGDGTDPHHIDLETIQRGMEKILSGVVGIRSDLAAQVLSGVREDDAIHVDSDAADCIVQAGLFGEVVYG